jgi:8-oxo-dGTP pyrophosphatase MutT (NUDIX family)
MSMSIIREYTSTVFVVHNDKVLMHPHKNLGIWLPPGGHLLPNELPEEAAIREVREETGLEVSLWQAPRSFYFDDNRLLVEPVCTQLIILRPDYHLIDFDFFAETTTDQLPPGFEESTNLRWISRDAIATLKTLENVKILAYQALDTFAAVTISR